MQEKRNGPERGNEMLPAANERKPNGHDLHPDQELVYRLKSAIDQRGRYSFRLDDMASGMAAGRGISNTAARTLIENRFTEQMGMSPQQYLDHHYNEQRRQGTELETTRARNNGQGRGR